MPASDRLREQERDEVQIDHLSRRMGRYNLVVAVSRRAKDIEERVDSVLVPSSGTLIYRSLREIAEGKARVFRSNEEVFERGSERRSVLPELPALTEPVAAVAVAADAADVPTEEIVEHED